MSAPARGLARCVLCRREVEFEGAAPTRCKAREGGCGAAKCMTVLRLPGRQGTRRYDPDGDWKRILAGIAARQAAKLEARGAAQAGEVA